MSGTSARPPAAVTATKLSTVLEYLGAGPAAIAAMELRLQSLAKMDPRINVGQIMDREGDTPTCEVTFTCTGYKPPVNGNPDPQAVRDLQRLLGDVNLDSCLLWSTITLLTED